MPNKVVILIKKGEASLAAHDLRRTAAALALKGGADLRQIQQMLGHASITTCERYLEPMRSLQVTAGDHLLWPPRLIPAKLSQNVYNFVPFMPLSYRFYGHRFYPVYDTFFAPSK